MYSEIKVSMEGFVGHKELVVERVVQLVLNYCQEILFVKGCSVSPYIF